MSSVIKNKISLISITFKNLCKTQSRSKNLQFNYLIYECNAILYRIGYLYGLVPM